jgi:hypothetical protein
LILQRGRRNRLFIDVWFIFAYSGTDMCKVQVSCPTSSKKNPPFSDYCVKSIALDLYSSYFFALSSHLPFVAFLGAIAWAAWPAAVLVMCVLVGILVASSSLSTAAIASPSASRGCCVAPGSARFTFRAVRAAVAQGERACDPAHCAGRRASNIRSCASWTLKDDSIKIR